MGTVYELIGILLIAAVSALLCRELGSRAAPLVALMAAVGCTSAALLRAGQLSLLLGALAEHPTAAEYVRDAMRTVGIGYVGGITQDIVSSLGEVQLARTVGLVVRLELVGMAIPYLVRVLEMIVGLVYE